MNEAIARCAEGAVFFRRSTIGLAFLVKNSSYRVETTVTANHLAGGTLGVAMRVVRISPGGGLPPTGARTGLRTPGTPSPRGPQKANHGGKSDSGGAGAPAGACCTSPHPITGWKRGQIATGYESYLPTTAF